MALVIFGRIPFLLLSVLMGPEETCLAFQVSLKVRKEKPKPVKRKLEGIKTDLRDLCSLKIASTKEATFQ